MQEFPSDPKSDLRRQMLSRLAELPTETRTKASARACALLDRQSPWRRARSILFFAPMPGELDLWPMLQRARAEGKQVTLPRFCPARGIYVAAQVQDPESDLARGRFGIREPREQCPEVGLNRLDFVLVPGVAFDLNGRRLGRGQGFYDRLLTAVGGITCGVAFDQQIVSVVPVEPHDIHLNCILTPTRWIEL